jgi:mannose-6-phosphate isomerase
MGLYLRLSNPVMNYAWGSFDAIHELLGEEHPGKEPKAELWMGAHPKAPSLVAVDGGLRPLDELIRDQPREILGAATAANFKDQLPFLFKVLSARQPLSIQAHPDAGQARAGFQRENELEIPLAAPHRNYRDANHKPELICALSEFWAMCGFRAPEEIADVLEQICPIGLADESKLLKHSGAGGNLKPFLTRMLQINPGERLKLIEEALGNTRKNATDMASAPVAYWMHAIAADFPGDIGILAPTFLNLIRLEPEEALYLPAASLHAYLRGTGIEIMASSDNVLRGGLTSKHVDVDELMETLSFAPWRPEVIHKSLLAEAESDYPCPVEEFRLSELRVSPGTDFISRQQRNVEILLCTRGLVRLRSLQDTGETFDLPRGASILVPASAPAYQLDGNGVIYRASVP